MQAISRRATLHEIVRDYGQATIDLQKLTLLLESQQRSKASQPGRLGSSSTSTQDLRQACERLAKAEEEMKRENPLDHYLILYVFLCTFMVKMILCCIFDHIIYGFL